MLDPDTRALHKSPAAGAYFLYKALVRYEAAVFTMLRPNPPHAIDTKEQHCQNKHQDAKEENLKNGAGFVACHALRKAFQFPMR